MVKINNIAAEYTKATLSVMYDNSINPTGLGSMGIHFKNNSTNIYVGIKFNVLTFITDKNIHTSINIEKRFLSDYINSLYGTKDYSVEDVPKDELVGFYINKDFIEIDIKSLLKSIYVVDTETYYGVVVKSVFNDNAGYGGLIHYFSPFYINNDLNNIGMLVYDNNKKLVINNNIVTKQQIDEDFFYSIWWLKQTLSANTIDVNKPVITYEDINLSKAESIYVDYFNNFNSLKKESRKPIDYENITSNSLLLKNKDSLIENKNNDVWIVDGVINCPGIKDNFIQTNYGVKEARNGYFDVEKDNSFKNIGYTSNTGIYGDNFYNSFFVENKYDLTLKECRVPSIQIFSNSETIKHLEEKDIEILRAMIFLSRTNKKEDAHKIISKYIKYFMPQYIKKSVANNFIENEIKITLPITMLAKKNKITDFKEAKNSVVFVVNPFYNYMFFKVITKEEDVVVNENELYVYAINNHKFGFSFDKFFWNNIPKEFRKNDYIKDFFGNIKYKDLSKNQNYNKLLKSISFNVTSVESVNDLLSNKSKDILSLLSAFKNNTYTTQHHFATTYLVDLNELDECLFKQNLIKTKQGFIKI